MYPLLLRYRMRAWLAENAVPEDERAPTIDQLLDGGTAASTDGTTGQER
jgi:hypothetical protein